GLGSDGWVVGAASHFRASSANGLRVHSRAMLSGLCQSAGSSPSLSAKASEAAADSAAPAPLVPEPFLVGGAGAATVSSSESSLASAKLMSLAAPLPFPLDRVNALKLLPELPGALFRLAKDELIMPIT